MSMSYPLSNQGQGPQMCPTSHNTPYPCPDAPGHAPVSQGSGPPGPIYRPPEQFLPPKLYGGAPVTQQPRPAPGGVPLNAPALGYLATVDVLLVHQEIEMVEIVTGFETKNRYKIKNDSAQQAFYAEEYSHWLPRNCMGYLREFEMRIY
ncbi:unnamed protein product, partial [Callosobruchus maculatus]